MVERRDDGYNNRATEETRKICRIKRMAEAEMQDGGDDSRRKINGRIRLIIIAESKMRYDRDDRQGRQRILQWRRSNIEAEAAEMW